MRSYRLSTFLQLKNKFDPTSLQLSKLDQDKEFKLHMVILNILSPCHKIVAIPKADYDGLSAADQFTKEKTDKMLAGISTIRTRLANKAKKRTAHKEVFLCCSQS